MIIKVNSIGDFEVMICSVIQNGEQKMRLFEHSHTVESVNGKKTTSYISCTYVFLCPLFELVYSDKLTPEEFKLLDESFEKFVMSREELRLESYESLSVDYANNCITLGKLKTVM